MSCSPRGPGSFAPVTPEKLASQELSASVGAPGPHGFAVRKLRRRHRVVEALTRPEGLALRSLPRANAARVHRIPPRVRDDRDTPLDLGRNKTGTYRCGRGESRSKIYTRRTCSMFRRMDCPYTYPR